LSNMDRFVRRIVARHTYIRTIDKPIDVV